MNFNIVAIEKLDDNSVKIKLVCPKASGTIYTAQAWLYVPWAEVGQYPIGKRFAFVEVAEAEA